MTLGQACPPECQRAQCAFKDSMTHGFCNSHYLSHFAAFFIDARTKRSVVESFALFLYKTQTTCFHRVLELAIGGRGPEGQTTPQRSPGAGDGSAEATWCRRHRMGGRAHEGP